MSDRSGPWGYITKSAVLSGDDQHRFRLDRSWETGQAPSMTFVMLNPSTADAMNDDPTIRRCVSFADREGFGAVTVLNLFSFRAKSPRDLFAAIADGRAADGDSSNRHHILSAFEEARGPVVLAWGAHAARPAAQRTLDRMARMLPDDGVYYLDELTKSGQPRHPLYVRGDADLNSWS